MSKEMTAVSVKEPLMHISKRDGIEPYKAWLIRLAAVLISLIVCAGVIFALTGLNPIEVYKGVFDGAVGTKRRVWMTIRDTLVLLCIAIGITPAFKMRFWNIGAEGQVLIGGVTSAAMMIYLGNSLPPVLLFPLMLAGSALSAMVWAAIPAFFKAYWNTNETLFTLMMNYVAMQVITYCIRRPYQSIRAMPTASPPFMSLTPRPNSHSPVSKSALASSGSMDIKVSSSFPCASFHASTSYA